MHKAKELTRQRQQGFGKSIISTDFNGTRIVAVGNQIYSSTKWKTFQDFLMFYIKEILGHDWGNAEISKPFNERHPIMQWYEKLCFFQRNFSSEKGKIVSAPMTGFVEAYLQLSYNLYQLGHNTIKNKYNDKIQKLLIKRIKNISQFAGAYYECYVFATMIKSGFEVDLIDETNGASKHCDFVVTHKKSKKRYSVEVKAINREGTYGAKNNTTRKSLESSVRDQLYKALNKPSNHPRIIFIEVNQSEKDIPSEKQWADNLASFVCSAEDLKISGKPTAPAFIIVTNHSHQPNLNTTKTMHGAVPLGYKIIDFGYNKSFSSLRSMHEARNKYRDVMNIMGNAP